jgi:hypothetical protein
LFFARGYKNRDVKARLMKRKSFISFGFKKLESNFRFNLDSASRKGIISGNSSLIFSLEVRRSLFEVICEPHLVQNKFSEEFILPQSGHWFCFDIGFLIIIWLFVI